MSLSAENVRPSPIRLLLVEDNQAFARMLMALLQRNTPETFETVWVTNANEALDQVAQQDDFHVILMDYFLPDMNGVALTEALRSNGNRTPIVFLTVNTDFERARDVLKVGVHDYILKDEITPPTLTVTILSAVDRKALHDRLETLEHSAQRLDAIREVIQSVATELRDPLEDMKSIIDQLLALDLSEKQRNYVVIMRDNHARIEKKLERLRELKSDKTVPYIKDIRMFDLS